MACLQFCRDGGSHGDGHYSHTSHHVLDHHPYDCLRTMCVVVGGTKQELEPLLCRLGFETLDEFRKKGILNIGDDQTEKVAMTSRKAACVRVLVVLQFLNYLEDPLFRFRS